mgnify:FL=1|tara:strand:- start:949 stop:1773 length:825 start_codon:yes stop_codon:yes gene_type:complete
MKAKHNKKRNSAFLYEVLTRELTKSIVGQDSKRSDLIKSIFREHFTTSSEIGKELSCYQALSESSELDQYTAEKMIFSAKKQYEKLDTAKIFQEQSQVIKKINKNLSTEVFKNFVPNYRSYATIAQIFNSTTPVKSRVLLEKQIIANMTSAPEEQASMEPVDSLVINSFSKKFNEQYDDLLPEQRNLLSKYVLSFGANEADFKLCVMNELKRIRTEVSKSLKLEEVKSDEEMVKNTNKVLEQIEKFNVSHLGKNEVLRILKLQNLVSEYQKDAN